MLWTIWLFLFPFRLSFQKRDPFSEISGFYGLMGPDVKMKTVPSLFDLFMADGLVQGVFFDKGEILFMKKNVETEKRKQKSPFLNPFDISNTNIVAIDNSYYSFFEHNNPYHLDISFEERTLKTLQKKSVPGVRLFSGHTKYNPFLKRITTLDYNVINKEVHIYSLDSNFSLLSKYKIPFTYVPMVHDFYMMDKKTIVIDSPFEWNFYASSWKNMMRFSVNKSTFIYCIQENNSFKKYKADESFFLFHYAYAREIKERDEIEIYAPLYESIDFSKIDICGRYRRIVLNKKTKKVRIERNDDLEKYSVDFPIVWEDKVILRHLDSDKKESNAFLICRDLKIIDTISLRDNLSICGEPTFLSIKEEPHLLFFCYDKKTCQNYIGLLHLYSKKLFTREISNTSLTIGFHSIFIPDKRK